MTISLRASSFIFPFSLFLTSLINLNSSSDLTLDKSNLGHLETTVTEFFISVVAKINFKYSGGSSSVLRRALKACLPTYELHL